jgi:carboxypeptidase Taq
MMPRGGGEARGEQLAALAGIAHDMFTAPDVADDLAAARRTASGDGANLALMRRAHRRATALPTSLVRRPPAPTPPARRSGARPRRPTSSARVQPFLAEVLRLQREIAQALSAATGLAPYDALMEGYQRGVTAGEVEPVFDAYAAWLREALPRARPSRPGTVRRIR